jgi:ferric-dicitrate binding protein FerR (iron transport regulator)
MKYQDYGIVDFIKDDFFVEWVSNPNSKSNEFWTKWMSSHPDQVPTILRAQQFISSINYDDFEALKEEEYIEMFENVLRKRPVSSLQIFNRGGKRYRLKVAASITIALISLVSYLWIATNGADLQETQQIIQYSKSNPMGQKSLITLPDGSKIKLNSGSTISYDSRFGLTNRMVELKGEAFFDITRNPSSPFIIKSGELATKVLGTSFNVRYYEDEDNIQVLVVSGEVTVSDNLGSYFVLNPHDVLEYYHYDKQVKKSVCTDFKSIIGWKDGLLIFSDESFSEVVDKIRQWYGVEIILEEGVSVEGYYTGEYQNKSLETVMDGISFTSEFDYSILNDNKILIKKKL